MSVGGPRRDLRFRGFQVQTLRLICFSCMLSRLICFLLSSVPVLMAKTDAASKP